MVDTACVLQWRPAFKIDPGRVPSDLSREGGSEPGRGEGGYIFLTDLVVGIRALLQGPSGLRRRAWLATATATDSGDDDDDDDCGKGDNAGTDDVD